MAFSAKNVLVIGAGISGFAAARIGRRLGAQVTLSDAKAEEELGAASDFAELRELGVRLVFGAQEQGLLDGVDLVIVSPAVPVRIPLVQAAYARQIPVISEVELAQDLAQSPFYAVTGTNGKTTTVALLGKLLATRYGAAKTGVGGNIGRALSEEALRVGADGAIAAEISSYQMEATQHFHPRAAAVLNVTPDHIKRHGSLEVYQAMKERIFREMGAGDCVVLNADDARTRGMAARVPEGARVCLFSGQEELGEGATVAHGQLVLRWDGAEIPLVAADEIGIKGPHNLANALAASALAYFAGCAPEKMRGVLKNFHGVEHRIEHFATVDGVPYYNDSKATNTDATEQALRTFEHIVLLAGGDDKMTDLAEMMNLVKERVEELILIGAAAARFREAAVAAGFPEEHIYAAGYSMPRAVELAHALAHGGQVVLLSPACASFDMYHNMAERGRDFKRLVRSFLPENERQEDEQEKDGGSDV